MKKARIFIVEDETLIAMELKDRLERMGHTVCGTAIRGEDAIGLITGIWPDLVLMDIKLAGKLDGIETAKRLRELVSVPVVYLTAYSDPAVLERAAGTGPFGYLVKPVGERELVATIEMALHKHAMEKGLRDSERLYRVMFECAQDAIFIINSGGGNLGGIANANAAAAAMHGYSINELRGMKMVALCTPEAAPALHDLQERALRGECCKQELSHRRKDGTVFPAEVSLGLLDMEGDKYVFCFARDISERRRADEQRDRLITDLRAAVEDLSRPRPE